MERLLDITEVSDILKLTPDYLLNCCSKYPDRIPKSFKIGSQRRFKESDVEEWVEQNYRQSVPGCELPRDVPMRNIQALVMAAKAYTF